MKRSATDNRLEVLIVGRHKATLNRILKTLRSLPVRIDGALTDDRTCDLLSRNRYDVISIGGGVEAASRTRIKDILIAAVPDIQVIEVPRPDAKSIDELAKKPIQMDGPDELARILTGLLEHRAMK